MTWRDLAQRIRKMPRAQQDQEIQLVLDLDGENQSVGALHLAQAPHDVFQGLGVGNALMLAEGDLYVTDAAPPTSG